MIEAVPPAAIFILGAALVPFFRGVVKKVYLLALPVIALCDTLLLLEGRSNVVRFMGYELVFCRVDSLSLVFSHVFILITFIGLVYSLHVKDDAQHAAALVYAGGALGVTFAGDLFSLYLFWEIMALSSVYLVLAARTDTSTASAFRYFMWHFFGGICLLAGIILYVTETGSPAFSHIGLDGLASYFIFVGFCLNAAVFPFHSWLPDAYPRATVTGAVFMSALTTKSAVYILARTFAGTEILVWAGAFMTCFPIFYAVIVNDMRRVLAYSLINQVGFMVCGIGIGSQLAINGVVAHAFCHIVYKALLFMSTGAVLHMTGKIRGTDLGGLYKTMPFTAVCCMIGAASISAFPLFSGFISKSLTVSAVAEQHRTIIWLMLLFASAGVFHHAGIKVPFFVFFGHDSGIRTSEPPMNMRVAMSIAAFICIFLGVYPDPLYAILPYSVDYEPYTVFHVVAMLELLMFGALAFTLLILSGYYPAEIRAVNLDTDWLARMPGRQFIRLCEGPLRVFGEVIEKVFSRFVGFFRSWDNKAVRLERGFDWIFHKALVSVPFVVNQRAKRINTEARGLSWNMVYILIPFVVLLFVIFIS